MTREEYEDLRTEVSESGRTLKSVLSERGIAYSTYNYWRRKAASLSPHQPLAPISVKESAPECESGGIYPDTGPCGVVLSFPNDVRNGDVFIFIGGNRRLMKLLHAEDGGMVMYVKRLEAGRFKVPEYDPGSRSYPMEWRDLVLMVEGIREDPSGRLRRLRAERREYHV